MARLAAPSFERFRIVVWFLPDRRTTQVGRIGDGWQEQENAASEGGEPGYCAGIDIGKDRHFVAADPAVSPEPVWAFDGFTRDLQAMADWLSSCGVTKVAMESTSVYWIPAYEVPERAGFEVHLMPPRMTK